MYTVIEHSPSFSSKLFSLVPRLLAVILLFKAHGLIKGWIKVLFMWLLGIVK